jgi:anti-anti-sigma factor
MIRAHREGNTLTLEIRGKATVMESPTVRELVERHISHGMRSLRVDLRDCTAIDNTFSGTLLSVEPQLAAREGTLTLVSPAPSVQDLLRRMGLEDLYTVEFAPRTLGPWAEIHLGPPTVEKVKDVVLSSHDELAHADVTNREASARSPTSSGGTDVRNKSLLRPMGRRRGRAVQ